MPNHISLHAIIALLLGSAGLLPMGLAFYPLLDGGLTPEGALVGVCGLALMILAFAFYRRRAIARRLLAILLVVNGLAWMYMAAVNLEFGEFPDTMILISLGVFFVLFPYALIKLLYHPRFSDEIDQGKGGFLDW